jgi:hypothetical protein
MPNLMKLVWRPTWSLHLLPSNREEDDQAKSRNVEGVKQAFRRAWRTQKLCWLVLLAVFLVGFSMFSSVRLGSERRENSRPQGWQRGPREPLKQTPVDTVLDESKDSETAPPATDRSLNLKMNRHDPVPIWYRSGSDHLEHHDEETKLDLTEALEGKSILFLGHAPVVRLGELLCRHLLTHTLHGTTARVNSGDRCRPVGEASLRSFAQGTRSTLKWALNFVGVRNSTIVAVVRDPFAQLPPRTDTNRGKEKKFRPSPTTSALDTAGQLLPLLPPEGFDLVVVGYGLDDLIKRNTFPRLVEERVDRSLIRLASSWAKPTTGVIAFTQLHAMQRLIRHVRPSWSQCLTEKRLAFLRRSIESGIRSASTAVEKRSKQLKEVGSVAFVVVDPFRATESSTPEGLMDHSASDPPLSSGEPTDQLDPFTFSTNLRKGILLDVVEWAFSLTAPLRWSSVQATAAEDIGTEERRIPVRFKGTKYEYLDAILPKVTSHPLAILPDDDPHSTGAEGKGADDVGSIRILSDRRRRDTLIATVANLTLLRSPSTEPNLLPGVDGIIQVGETVAWKEIPSCECDLRSEQRPFASIHPSCLDEQSIISIDVVLRFLTAKGWKLEPSRLQKISMMRMLCGDVSPTHGDAANRELAQEHLHQENGRIIMGRDVTLFRECLASQGVSEHAASWTDYDSPTAERFLKWVFPDGHDQPPAFPPPCSCRTQSSLIAPYQAAVDEFQADRLTAKVNSFCAAEYAEGQQFLAENWRKGPCKWLKQHDFKDLLSD